MGMKSGFVGGGSSLDPFFLEEFVYQGNVPVPQYENANGKTQVFNYPSSPAVFITGGQSKITNYAPTPYSPTNAAHIFNFSIYNGGLYAAADPLLGTSYNRASYALRFADKMIAASKCADVILVPIAIAGSTFADWAPGGAQNRRLIATARRLAIAGLTVEATLWDQGETASTNAESAAAVTAGIRGIVDTLRAEGVTAPFYPTLTGYVGDATVSGQQTAVRLGQANAVDHVTRNIWQGVDTDSLNNTYRDAGKIHFNDTGSDAVAALWTALLP